jgi:membrane protease YdiL (CAAX protease family)
MSFSADERHVADRGDLPSLTQQIRLQKLTVVRYVLLGLGGLICVLGIALIAGAKDVARAQVEKELRDDGVKRAQLGPEELERVRKYEERAGRILRLVGGLFTGVGIVYLIFAGFVKKYPLPITIMSLALYITGNALTLLNPQEPFAFVAGTWWLSIGVIIALSMSLRVAIAYAREQRRTEHLAERARQKDEEFEESAGDPVREFGIEVQRRICWRCDKESDRQLYSCPFCRAPFGSRRRAAREDEHGIETFHRDARPVKIVLWFFAVLLSVTIFQAWYIHFGPGLPQGDRKQQEMALIKQMLVVEAIDTVLVFIAIVWAGAPSRFRQSGGTRLATWLLGLPILALLLGINIGYGKLLLEYIGEQPHIEVIPINFENYFWLVLLSVCIQPAVVEELFFRYLCLGHLKRVMNQHGAIWVTAVMFGLAHLHNPIGMPVLIIIGAGFGYVRVKSGGLTLPILLHGLHNAIVVMLEGKI